MKNRIYSWFRIWYQPQRTIREIVEEPPRNRVYLFIVLAGLAFAYTFFDLNNAADQQPLGALVAKGLIIGPLVSVLGTLLITVGLFVALRAFNRKIKYRFVARLITRGYFPVVLCMLVWILNFILLDGAGFSAETGKGFTYWLFTFINATSLIAIPVYMVIFLAEIIQSQWWFAGLIYLVGLITAGMFGGMLYFLFTLFANFIMFFNDPNFSFFFPYLSN